MNIKPKLTLEALKEAIENIDRKDGIAPFEHRYLIGIETLLPVWREGRRLGLRLSRVKEQRIVIVENNYKRLAEFHIARPGKIPIGQIIGLDALMTLTQSPSFDRDGKRFEVEYRLYRNR